MENIEREYYGGLHAEVDIHKMTPAFRDIMKNLQISQLHSAWQIEDILRRPDLFTEGVYQGDPANIATIKMFDQRLKTFVPNKFEEIKNLLCEILLNLEKYCVSFFQGKEDAYLETAYSYENKRKELSESIKNNIDRIADIIVTYRKGGLSLKMLGMHANDLARKCDCYDAPILFIFPDVCQSVRDACANIIRWVELDSQYALFLYNDLVEIQRKREAHFRKVRDLRERRCQLDHRIKKIHRDIDELVKQFERFRNRERDIRDDVNKLRLKIEDLETELEAKEREIKALRMAARYQTAEKESTKSGSPNNEAVEDVAAEISKLRINISTFTRQIESCNNKLKLVDDKKEKIARKKSTLIRFQKLSLTQETELILAEHELARLERCYSQLKDIHTFRVSPDITKKIFHNIPINPTRCGVAKVTPAGKHGNKTEITGNILKVNWLTKCLETMHVSLQGCVLCVNKVLKWPSGLCFNLTRSMPSILSGTCQWKEIAIFFA